jgi:hypothetical protein
MQQMRKPYARTASRVNVNRLGAALAQAGSFAATYAFCASTIKGADPLIVFFIAAGVEVILMLGKSVLFNASRADDAVGWASVVIDTVLNAGGLWPLAKNIAGTPSGLMIAEALGLEAKIGLIPALILALLGGYLLAVLPHRLWNAGKIDDD